MHQSAHHMEARVRWSASYLSSALLKKRLSWAPIVHEARRDLLHHSLVWDWRPCYRCSCGDCFEGLSLELEKDTA